MHLLNRPLIAESFWATCRVRAHAVISPNRGCSFLLKSTLTLFSQLPCWLCFYRFGSQEALEGHVQTELVVLLFLPEREKRKLLTLVLSADDQSVCQWARIMHNQIQSWGGNKVNPLYDPATICVPVPVIGLFCALHHGLIQPGVLMIHIKFQTKPAGSMYFLQSVKLDG